MSTKKFLTGALVGGIVFFFLGYLFYGVMLQDFMKQNAGTATNVDRDMSGFVWWALAAGNLAMGCLLSYVINKSNAASMQGGLKRGFIVFLLTGLSFDLMLYATTNIATLKGLSVDVATMAVIGAIAGAVTGWVCAMVGKTATDVATA
ncbi:MAG: hypothetical protein JWN76_3694 [Chitinophagaceae bacterium]|nr:hypothetical protein [Chitinophagaceae bacterium]